MILANGGVILDKCHVVDGEDPHGGEITSLKIASPELSFSGSPASVVYHKNSEVARCETLSRERILPQITAPYRH